MKAEPRASQPPAPSARARRPLTSVVVEGFSSRLAFGILSFAVPLYAYSLGLDLAQIGLLLATNMAVAMLLKPLMGRLIDRIGVRTAYVLAVLLRTIVVLGLLLATTAAALFAARALHGVAIALRDPASSTVLAALGGKKAVAQRFAWFQTAKSVAGSAGQFGAGVALTIWVDDYATVFTIAAILSAVPLGVVLWGLRGELVEGLRLPREQRAPHMSPDLRRALVPYMGLGAMITGTAYLMANLLPVLAVEHMGLAPAAAGSLYLVKSLVSLTGPGWGWVADRVSHRLVLGVRGLGNGLSSLIWLFFPSYAGLLAGKILDDLGKAAYAPAWGRVMADVSELDPARRSQTLAWMSSAEDAGEMAGPVVAGVVWSLWGLPALLLIRAGAALATEGYAFWLGRRLREPDATAGEGRSTRPREA
ncbi:MAG: MFS transporter [Micrococcus sp.]|nr:MFS transporter [Micrococcus sp.]